MKLTTLVEIIRIRQEIREMVEKDDISMDEKRRHFSFYRARASMEWIRPEIKGNERTAVD
ncbi:hypothetical protein ACV3PA_16490 (plasmid) [Exiguobacterium acetylicum]